MSAKERLSPMGSAGPHITARTTLMTAPRTQLAPILARDGLEAGCCCPTAVQEEGSPS